jgi:hypothetical protein
MMFRLGLFLTNRVFLHFLVLTIIACLLPSGKIIRDNLYGHDNHPQSAVVYLGVNSGILGHTHLAVSRRSLSASTYMRRIILSRIFYQGSFLENNIRLFLFDKFPAELAPGFYNIVSPLKAISTLLC